MYSISRGGRDRVLGTSIKEERVLMPGGGLVVGEGWGGGGSGGCLEGSRGGGGGGGKGDVEGVEVVEVVGDDMDGSIVAFFLRDWIFSLYTSLSSLTLFRPCLL